VTVWKDSDGDEQMMLWVKDAPPSPKEEEPDQTKKPQGGVLAGGKKVVREHVVRAKL
jgi:hypothetical protein